MIADTIGQQRLFPATAQPIEKTRLFTEPPCRLHAAQ